MAKTLNEGRPDRIRLSVRWRVLSRCAVAVAGLLFFVSCNRSEPTSLRSLSPDGAARDLGTPCGAPGQPACAAGSTDVSVFVDPGSPLPMPPGQLPPMVPPQGVLPGTPLVARVHILNAGAGNFDVTLTGPNGVVVQSWPDTASNFQGIVDVHFTAALPTGSYVVNANFLGSATYPPSSGSRSYLVYVVNTPPVARAGPDQTVYRTSPAGAVVSFDGSASSDAEGPIAEYDWYEAFGPGTTPLFLGNGPTLSHLFALGDHMVALTVIDGGGLRNRTYVNVHVLNVAPTAVAGPNQTLECVRGGALANLNGSGSSDLDGFITNYFWTSTAGNTSGRVASMQVPMGSTVFTLTVTDNNGATGRATTNVTVLDTRPPTLSMLVSPTELWSPNHKMVKVASGISALDACDPSATVQVTVTSNEAVNGTGDGNTAPDWQVVQNADGTYDVYVRSERSGNLNDRIYTITAVAQDRSGNSVTKTATVTVPHDR